MLAHPHRTQSTFALLLLTCFAAVCPGAAQDTAASSMTAKQVAQKMLPAIVKLEVFNASGQMTSTGSGFTVRPDGIVVTNFHVIEKAHAARAVLGNNDVVNVLGAIEIDTKRDFAILKLQAVDMPALTMGNSDRAEPGDDVIALGAPLGLTGSVSTGVVSHVRDWEGHRVVQHTAAISPGSSGGPLVNRAGEVIGVNTFFLEKGNSLFFAVPVNYVRASLQNSDGKWATLSKLQEILLKAREEEAVTARKELLQKAFTTYEDPQSLFTVATPRHWRVERSQYDDDDARHVVVMFSSPEAEQAKIGDWLSEGIRVHLRFPARGRAWDLAAAKDWKQRQFAGLHAAYHNAKTGERTSTQLGKLKADEQVLAGESERVSKPETAVLWVVADPQCLMTVELVAPVDQKDVLSLTYEVIKSTFNAKWSRN